MEGKFTAESKIVGDEPLLYEELTKISLLKKPSHCLDDIFVGRNPMTLKRWMYGGCRSIRSETSDPGHADRKL